LLLATSTYHGNSLFGKRDDLRWTSESPGSRKLAEIDHILTNRKWLPFDSSVVPGFCSGSD
ncbi:hypothetical protein Angca_000441, partial [Angiostrongylus cantonensis]